MRRPAHEMLPGDSFDALFKTGPKKTKSAPSYIRNVPPYAECETETTNKRHDAEGWLCSGGKRISLFCRKHAEACIDEYREKLGDTSWHFEEQWP